MTWDVTRCKNDKFSWKRLLFVIIDKNHRCCYRSHRGKYNGTKKKLVHHNTNITTITDETLTLNSSPSLFYPSHLSRRDSRFRAFLWRRMEFQDTHLSWPGAQSTSASRWLVEFAIKKIDETRGWRGLISPTNLLLRRFSSFSSFVRYSLMFILFRQLKRRVTLLTILGQIHLSLPPWRSHANVFMKWNERRGLKAYLVHFDFNYRIFYSTQWKRRDNMR